MNYLTWVTKSVNEATGKVSYNFNNSYVCNY